MHGDYHRLALRQLSQHINVSVIQKQPLVTDLQGQQPSS